MRKKDDHMKNVQLRPAHNVQIVTENQFSTHYDFYPNPGDTLTLIPFLDEFKERYDKYPEKNVADAGYSSEENYEFMEKNEIKAYVKYNYFHKENSKKFKNNGFLIQNLYYNKEQDYYVCPMGQHIDKVGNTSRKNESGFVSHISIYGAKNCTGCPLRSLCHKAKGERRIEVNHNLNRHREKVMMDFAIFAVAFNILKLHRKNGECGKKYIRTTKNECLFMFFCSFCLL